MLDFPLIGNHWSVTAPLDIKHDCYTHRDLRSFDIKMKSVILLNLLLSFIATLGPWGFSFAEYLASLSLPDMATMWYYYLANPPNLPTPPN